MQYTKTNQNHVLPLLRMINVKNLSGIENWLKKGYNPNTPYQNILPISRCIEDNYEEGISLLISYGANPNGKTPQYQESHLLEALQKNKDKIVKLLLQKGAEPGTDVYEFLICKHAKVMAIRMSMGESITESHLLNYLPKI